MLDSTENAMRCPAYQGYHYPPPTPRLLRALKELEQMTTNIAQRGIWLCDYSLNPKWNKPESEPLRDMRTILTDHEKRTTMRCDHMVMAHDVAQCLLAHPQVAERVRHGAPRPQGVAQLLSQLLGLEVTIDDQVVAVGDGDTLDDSKVVRLEYAMRGCFVAWPQAGLSQRQRSEIGAFGYDLLA